MSHILYKSKIKNLGPISTGEKGLIKKSPTQIARQFSVFVLGLAVGGACLIGGGDVWAQGSASRVTIPKETIKKAERQLKQKSQSQDDEGVEKLEVIGSHIKRLDMEGPSPVQILDREDLDRSGFNSVADVLRETNSNSFGSTKEASGSNAAGVAHVDLRGLGSSRTLVLLNGSRLPSDAVTGAVDLNLIPMAAVERIEILKDGASALYGSDALGGVVNIVTRKDFSGTEVSLQKSLTSQVGGEKLQVGLVNGISSRRWNVVNVAHYRKNETIANKDRSFSNKGLSNFGSPGSYRQVNADSTTGLWQGDPACPAGLLDQDPTDGNKCQFLHSDFSTGLPQLEQMSLMSEAKYESPSGFGFNVRGGVIQKKALWQFAPSPGRFSIDADVADKLGPGGGPLPGVAPGSDIQVLYRLAELGPRTTKIETNAYNALLGVSQEIGESWEVSLSAGYNHVSKVDKGIDGYALADEVEKRFESGAFNFLAPEGQRGDLSSAKFIPTEKSTSENFSTDLKFAGELGEMSGGALGMAVGVNVSHEKFTDKVDKQTSDGNVVGNAGSNGEGQRDTQSAFAEVSIPVTSIWEIQVAARHDKFSDFGSTTNPKLATRVQISPSLLFRASAGTGFKAPQLVDLYASSSRGFPRFIDAVACAKEKAAGGATPRCTPRQYEVVSGGNPGLEEEKSVSYNAGLIYEPVKQFNVGFDVWLTKMDNVVDIDYDDMTKAELSGNLAGNGVIINRNPTTGLIEDVVAPLQNLASREVLGIDFHNEIKGRLPFGKVKLKIEHSHLIYFKEEGFPGAGFRDVLGENLKPSWRNVVSMHYAPSSNINSSLIARTIGSHQKAVEDEGKLKDYTEVDLQASYETSTNAVITAGVKNILGSQPPHDETAGFPEVEGDLYDTIGRQFYLNYKQTF